jgi:hypothetical protein
MQIKKGVLVSARDALGAFAAAIPSPARNWLRLVFRDVNNKLSLRVSTIPTAHEPTLDMAFIDALNGRAYPASVPGGWTIRLDTHYLGGLRHWHRWEIADLGVLIMFRTLPWSVTLPVVGTPPKPSSRDVGARVLPAVGMREALTSEQKGYSPTYNDLVANARPEFLGVHTAGWRLEHFIVDRLLACKDGHHNPSMKLDEGLSEIFFRRSGPIAAALSITIDSQDADVRPDKAKVRDKDQP